MAYSHLPINIIIKSFQYLQDNDFRQTILLNKYVSKCLLSEFQLRNRKSQFIRIIIDGLINRDTCISNIQLEKGYQNKYSCKSKRDYRRGSLFCNFCCHIYYHTT